MKAIITLLFVLFIGFAAQAQDAKVQTIEMTIVTETVAKEVVIEKTPEVARLYRRANSRVKKALSFTTKRNRAKVA
ncbi:MAG: hypothetical protein ACR2MT_09695 [Aurantibacter sp.]